MALYTLLNMDRKVCDLDIDESGYIARIRKIHCAECAPFGISLGRGMPGLHLRQWWANRIIPSSRQSVESLLLETGCQNLSALAVKHLGLSLSDTFWLRPETHAELAWADVNLFANDFPDSLGIIAAHGNRNSFHPDASTNGDLPKKWVIKDGGRLLVKGGRRPFRQEPCNEYAASLLLEAFGVAHVDYQIDLESRQSLCPCFVIANEEFVPAWYLVQSGKKSNHENWYSYLLRRLEELGLDDGEEFIRQMLLFDYIIANEDRHLNNFGVIRNSESLRITGFAPLFDNGYSFWCQSANEEIGQPVEVKPFHTDQKRQLAMIGDFRLGTSLDSIAEIIAPVFQEYLADSLRAERIVKAVEERFREMQGSERLKK